MKKIILVSLLVLACASGVRAQVVTTSQSTNTACAPITVSSSVVTPMIVSTDSAIAPALPRVLSIQNQDSGHAIFCSGDSAVAVSGTTHLGWSIADAGAFRDFTLLGTQQWYCLAVTASVQTVVCNTH